MERTSRAGRKSLLLPKIKFRLEAWLEKAVDVVFYSENFEICMDALVVFAGLYFLLHIIVAWIKGWPLWIY